MTLVEDNSNDTTRVCPACTPLEPTVRVVVVRAADAVADATRRT